MEWDIIKNNLDAFGFGMGIVESYFPYQSNKIEDTIDRFRDKCFEFSKHGTTTWFGYIFGIGVFPMLMLLASLFPFDFSDVTETMWIIIGVLAAPSLLMILVALLATLLDVLDRIHPKNRSLNSLLNLIGLIGLLLDNVSF